MILEPFVERARSALGRLRLSGEGPIVEPFTMRQNGVDVSCDGRRVDVNGAASVSRRRPSEVASGAVSVVGVGDVTVVAAGREVSVDAPDGVAVYANGRPIPPADCDGVGE